MMALLKKDRTWLLGSFLIGTGIFAAVVFDRRPDLIWIGGERRNAEEIVTAWWICAAAFGLYAGLRDRLLGTREYLLHRPVRAQRIFWTRCLGCGLVMVVAALLPYLLMWVNPFDAENRAVWEFDRIWTLLALSTSMWTLFAVGMYGATVPGTKFMAVLQTALIGVPAIFLAWRLQFPFGDAWAVSPWTYVVVQAALSGCLLWISAGHFVRGQDRDQDVAPRPKVANMSLLAVSAIVLAAIPISELQRDCYQALISSYPLVREREDGTLERVKRVWDGKQLLLQVVDENHEPTDAPPEVFEVGSMGRHKMRWSPWGPRWPDFERQLEPDHDKERYGPALGGIRMPVSHGWGSGGGVDIQAYFQLPEGVVEAYGLYSLPHGESYPPWRRSFGRTDGRSFSPETYFRGGENNTPVLAFDPADGSVWRITLSKDSEGFSRVPTPEGDRITGLASLHRWKVVSERPQRLWAEGRRLGARGAKGTYLWEEGRFVLAPEEWLPPKRPGNKAAVQSSDVHPRRIGRDPIEFRLVFENAAGEVKFSAAYRPQTSGEKAAAFFVYAGSVARSPVLAVASLGFEAPGIWPFDPLITHGGRSWLLALNLAFAALLVFVTRRHLRKRGANAPTMLLWTVLVAMGGLPVALVMELLERKRSYAKVTVTEPLDAPALLIQSA